MFTCVVIFTVCFYVEGRICHITRWKFYFGTEWVFFSVFLNRKHIFGQNSCSELLMREMKLHQTWQRHLRFRASWSCLRYVSCYYYHYYYCYNNNNNNNNDNYYYYYYYYYYYRYYRYLIYFSVRFKRGTIWANLFATFKFSFQLLLYSFFVKWITCNQSYGSLLT